jgi:hypothetical protein
MMPARQLAKMVTDAMEEACPARLVQLAESNQLVEYLTRKIQAFKLQYVRAMDGKPRAADPMVMESLLPMLAEHPTQKNPQPLTPEQSRRVETALDQFEEQNQRQNQQATSPAESSVAISD